MKVHLKTTNDNQELLTRLNKLNKVNKQIHKLIKLSRVYINEFNFRQLPQKDKSRPKVLVSIKDYTMMKYVVIK